MNSAAYIRATSPMSASPARARSNVRSYLSKNRRTAASTAPSSGMSGPLTP